MARRYFSLDRIPRSPFLPPVGSLRRAPKLPAKADFLARYVTIRDQGDEGACTGFAETGQFEVARRAQGYPEPELVFSPQFLYYLEGKVEGHPGADDGAIPTDGLAILEHIGCCPESYDVYVAGDIQPPSAKAMAVAIRYRIQSFAPVSRVNRMASSPRQGLRPLLQLLAARRPVNAAIAVYRSFEQTADGQIPMPGSAGQDQLLGGHDVFLVGYGDEATAPGGGWIKGVNSWGRAWGDKGFFYLPYAYVYDAALTPGMWSIVLPSKSRPALCARLCGRA